MRTHSLLPSPPLFSTRLHTEGATAVQGAEVSTGQAVDSAGERDDITAGTLLPLSAPTAESGETGFPGNRPQLNHYSSTAQFSQ